MFLFVLKVIVETDATGETGSEEYRDTHRVDVISNLSILSISSIHIANVILHETPLDCDNLDAHCIYTGFQKRDYWRRKSFCCCESRVSAAKGQDVNEIQNRYSIYLMVIRRFVDTGLFYSKSKNATLSFSKIKSSFNEKLNSIFPPLI